MAKFIPFLFFILAFGLASYPAIASAQTPAPSSAATTTTTIPPEVLADIRTRIADIGAKIAALRQSLMATHRVMLDAGLRLGSKSDAVKALQAILAADPEIYPEGLITGTYGPLTARAVERFQRKHGLAQLGAIGPETLERLRGMLAQTPLALEGPERKLCAAVPPGHLLAPGWLRNHLGTSTLPLIPLCRILPPGISNQLGTTTPQGMTVPPAPSASTGTTTPQQGQGNMPLSGTTTPPTGAGTGTTTPSAGTMGTTTPSGTGTTTPL